MRPKPLIPTRTAILRPPCPVSDSPTRAEPEHARQSRRVVGMPVPGRHASATPVPRPNPGSGLRRPRARPPPHRETYPPGRRDRARRQVVGGVEAGRLRQLRAEVRHLHDRAGVAAMRLAQRPDAHDGHDARVERTGCEHHLIGGGDRRDGVRRAPPRRRARARPGGCCGCSPPRPGPRPGSSSPARACCTSAFSSTGSSGGGQHASRRPRGAGRPRRARRRSAEGLGETDDHQVAERVAVELTAGEPVLEGGRPHAVVVGERDEAAAEVARGGDTEVAAQPARRAAVVGDAHDRGDRAGVLADGAERDREPVTAPERDDRGSVHLLAASSSLTVEVPVVHAWLEAEPLQHARELRRRSRRCGAGRRCTRCRSRGTPCPRARTPAGAARAAARARRGTPAHRVDSSRSRAPSGRCPASGRSSSTQCGFGRNRQSSTRSTSSGRPCLYPNDTTLVCSDPAVWSASANSSRMRSRSSCTLSSDVSTTTSAPPFRSSSSARSATMPSDTRSPAASGCLRRVAS